MFETADRALGGSPEIVVYNPSARVRGPLVDLDPEGVLHAIKVSAYGGFLVAQARLMGILVGGATAAVRPPGQARLRQMTQGQAALQRDRFRCPAKPDHGWRRHRVHRPATTVSTRSHAKSPSSRSSLASMAPSRL